MIDLNKLKELAQKATAGPWISTGNGIHSADPKYTDYGGNVCVMTNESEELEANSELIKMMNPKNVLDLVDKLDTAIKALEHSANGCLVPPDGGSPNVNDHIDNAKMALAFIKKS